MSCGSDTQKSSSRSQVGVARTNPAGTVKVHASGESGPEANKELFVFQKFDGICKIARYCFSTMNPPKTKGEPGGHVKLRVVRAHELLAFGG
jgi:hypothetical protein